MVEGSSEICEQQEQSSFRLKRLSSKSTTKEQCLELCCKEEGCSIPLRVKKHCYGISCAKKELCQVVFEQLKEFQGHRVDKRDVEDEDEENGSGNWENDQGKALGIYQKRESLALNITDDDLPAYGKRQGEQGQEFPAFLIARTKGDLQDNSRNGNLTISYHESKGIALLK